MLCNSAFNFSESLQIFAYLREEITRFRQRFNTKECRNTVNAVFPEKKNLQLASTLLSYRVIVQSIDSACSIADEVLRAANI